jgi:hypothetical protein
MTSKTKRIGSLTAAALILLVPAAVWTQRWNIFDTIRLRNYQPSAEVAQLADQTTMNGKTRRLFYVYRPNLEDKQSFNNNCQTTEKTIVLGCYVAGNYIHLYKVTDERLNGIIQVTAAHETLHAAYDRLSRSDKTSVNKLINGAYATLTDQRIKDTIEDYRKNGADTTNELHSILGTEVRNLPAALEQYYTRYFTNRLAIVGYSEKYEQAFTQRKQKIAEDDTKLAGLKQQIENSEADLKSREQALSAERNRLNALLAAKNYEAYNTSVPGFNAQVNAYNAQVARIRKLIDQYNVIVAERNAIATEEGELVKAIDSRPDTLQGQ